MKKIYIFTILLLFSTTYVSAGHYPQNTVGRIVLQVEEHGEAWYVYPDNMLRYYLGQPQDAFQVMRKLGLGATHDFLSQTEIFPDNVLGKILLDVETNGEAYYISPTNKRKYYLARPSDAFRIMRELGLGITTSDLVNIPVGDIESQEIESMPDDLLNNQKIDFVNHTVPFLSQAPFGDWADQRQQDGCEESSALMAVAWARGENITKERGLEVVLASSDYSLIKYGEYRDISAKNTVDWIFKDYLNFDSVALKKDVTAKDIISELQNAKLVVAPMNGQLLGNPNFTHPGPPRHMLLVKGYDPETDEFITNDPGTRNGADYRYSKDILFAAIRDYPTGYHEHIETIEKNIIVISK